MKLKKTVLRIAVVILLFGCLPTGTLQVGLEATATPVPASAAPGITAIPPENTQPAPATEPAAPSGTPAPGETPSSTVIAAPPPSPEMGFVSGNLCYPSEFIPPLAAYFQHTETGQTFALNTQLNQFAYNTELPPGTYTAFAWVIGGGYGGLYSPAIACGLTVDCTDHAPLPFTIQPGQLTNGIDLCDWYGDQQQIPPPVAQFTPVVSGERILILNPGPGSRLTSPLHISGYADSTFEQHLVVRIVLDDGSELVVTPTILQSEMGKRGAFEIEIPFTISGERQAFIQVYETSARDGGITHLASVGVTLSESGPANIVPGTFHGERIILTQYPFGNAFAQGGMIHIEGIAVASFEQTLVIEIYDQYGNLIGQLPVIVNAPDLGQPGTFSADVPYTLSEAGPGRIVVRDPSVVFDGSVHLASVEIYLEP